MTVFSSDPKGVKTLLILLIDINHLVFEHQPNEIFTINNGKKVSVVKRTYLPFVAAIFKGKPSRPTKLIS